MNLRLLTGFPIRCTSEMIVLDSRFKCNCHAQSKETCFSVHGNYFSATHNECQPLTIENSQEKKEIRIYVGVQASASL